MMRFSSNNWEQDPDFVKELLRYNELHHHDYNPSLNTRQSKVIFEKVLNIKVPRSKLDYDRRFMVKAPESRMFVITNTSQKD